MNGFKLFTRRQRWPDSISRRQFMLSMLAAGAGAACSDSGDAPPTTSINPTDDTLADEGADSTWDVIVVGGGAAGLAAAIGAKRADPRASVLVLEAKPTTGGTSFRSGGRLWIPNNADLRAAGLNDPKDMCLRYMARLSYPDRYDASQPWLGLEPRHHALLSAFFDHGSEMLDYYRASGVMPWEAERGAYLPTSADPLDLNGTLAPDYRPDLPENVTKFGRSVLPLRYDPTGLTVDIPTLELPNYGASLSGIDLILWMRTAALRQGVRFRSGQRVRDLLVRRHANGRLAVEGVQVDREYAARRGVIFAAGGYSKNLERLNRQFTGVRQFTGGGCAVTSAQGDFIDIAERHGLLLENMDSAWFIQNIYEQYNVDPDSVLTPNYLLFQAYWPNGDSMVMVNRQGQRVVNEKMNYHQRAQVHFAPDNRFLVSVFDQHALSNFAAIGGHITPLLNTLIGPALTTEALTNMIERRFERDPQTSAFGLSANFRTGLDATLARFAEFARSGVDADFGRGDSPLDVWWHSFCLNFSGVNVPPIRRDCISANIDDNGVRYPNPTLRPLAPPYWAVILSSGLQDTNGGPAIDEHARVLDLDGYPVEGLYGAGNCIASPAGKGYWGAGGTLGPAMVFGDIAGLHAALRR